MDFPLNLDPLAPTTTRLPRRVRAGTPPRRIRALRWFSSCYPSGYWHIGNSWEQHPKALRGVFPGSPHYFWALCGSSGRDPHLAPLSADELPATVEVLRPAVYSKAQQTRLLCERCLTLATSRSILDRPPRLTP